MKYKLTNETKIVFGRTLHKIVCVTAFANVAAGEAGGWIESEKNLNQCGDAWVYGDAMVYDDARVCDNAWVYGDARVYGDAWVCGKAKVYGDARVYGYAMVCDNAKVCGDARVYGNAKVCGDAWVYGNAMVHGDADYILLKNNWSSGRYFTYTLSNNMWKVGCFYGTGEELIKKAYADSEISGKCYEASVRYVEELLKIKSEVK